MKKILIVSLALFMVGIGATGWAIPLDDPAVLHIGNGATGSCPTGNEPGCPDDPNSSLSAVELSIYLNGAGQPALSNPLILIIGIPSGGDFDPYLLGAPVIASVQFFDEFGGGTAAVAVTSAEVPTTPLVPLDPPARLDPGEEAYRASGYDNSTNNSNSFTNWAGAENSLLGLDPANFALFAYRLNQSIDGGDLLNVTFAGSGLPQGTFAIAYGCNGDAGDCLDGSCAGGTGKTYTTPFTEAGFVVSVPDASVMFLLGSALIGLFGLSRRKVRK